MNVNLYQLMTERNKLEDKLKSYKRNTTTGLVVILIGIGCIAAGFILWGFVCLLLGGLTAGTGAIKRGEAEERLTQLEGEITKAMNVD
jgi:hypothetical protein